MALLFVPSLDAQPKTASKVPPAKRTALAATPTPLPPVAWRNARWGMTAEEVLAAFPGEAQIKDPATRPWARTYCAVIIPRYEIEGSEFEVFFLFGDDSHTLESVHLHTPDKARPIPEAYERLKPLLTQKYGKPASEGEERSRGNDDRNTYWFLPTTSIQLGYTSMSSLNFRTLVIIYKMPGDAPTDKI